jgi:hypothetical protein
MDQYPKIMTTKEVAARAPIAITVDNLGPFLRTWSARIHWWFHQRQDQRPDTS